MSKNSARARVAQLDEWLKQFNTVKGDTIKTKIEKRSRANHYRARGVQ